ncbi:MAG TPA: DUF748 domain-containing protein [Steroidobacteraceae bacterium]|nr:DUF748 domain-containing protein [Steroidobacteraceae bacterium]
MVGAGGLHVQLGLASLWRRAASFSEIVLDRPFVHVLIRPDGSLNLGDLAKPASGASAAPPGKSAPPRLVIERLSVSKGHAVYEDRSRSTPLRAELVSVDFDLRNFSTIRASSDEYTLDFATPLGERFHWGGTVGLDPVSSHGRFQIDALRAPTIASFLGDALPFEISSGLIELQGDYALAVGTPKQMRVDVSHLALTDLGVRPRKSTTDDIHLKLIDIESTRFDWAQRSVSVGAVRVAGGTLLAWMNPDGTSSLSALRPPGPATPPPPERTQVPPGFSRARALPARGGRSRLRISRSAGSNYTPRIADSTQPRLSISGTLRCRFEAINRPATLRSTSRSD